MDEEQTEETEQNEPMRFIVSGIDLTDIKIENEEDPTVNYTDINVENIVFSEIKEKTVPKKKGAEKNEKEQSAEEKKKEEEDQKYKQIDFSYLYPTNDEEKPLKKSAFLWNGYE